MSNAAVAAPELQEPVVKCRMRRAVCAQRRLDHLTWTSAFFHPNHHLHLLLSRPIWHLLSHASHCLPHPTPNLYSSPLSRPRQRSCNRL